MTEWADEINECVAALVRANRPLAAHTLAVRALRVDPNHIKLWANLGGALAGLRRYDQAEEALKTALQLAPGHPIALGNLALVYEARGEHERAEQVFADVYEYTPDKPAIRWNQAMMYLRRGEYDLGLRYYDARLDANKYGQLSSPMWNGEDLTGKSIYVEIEQGVGDIIMFSRFLPWLAEHAGHVYLKVNKAAGPLLTEFPVEPVEKEVNADYATFLGSIPRWYGLQPDAVPPPPDLMRRAVEKFSLELPQPGVADALKVGVCWHGNPIGERNYERSVPLSSLMPLGYDPRVWLYSLQAGDAAQHIDQLGAFNLIQDLSKELAEGGFLATGAAILNCDLVITCCTSVAHLAGTLGVPTWVMLCADPYWMWFHDGRSDSPWYPSVRVFRQKRMDDWGPVVSEIFSALTQWASHS